MGCIVLAVPAAFTCLSKTLTFALRVAIVYLMANSIGLTGQLIRRVRVRSERLRLRVSSEMLLVTVFWNPALWERLGFCRPRAVVMELHAQRAEVGIS